MAKNWIEDGSKMFGISSTPTSVRQQFSYGSQQTNQQPNITNNLNGLPQSPPLQSSTSASVSALSSQSSSSNSLRKNVEIESLRNYNTNNNNTNNNVYNNNNSTNSSSYPQKSHMSSTSSSLSNSTSSSTAVSTTGASSTSLLQVPSRVNSVPNNSTSSSSNNNNSSSSFLHPGETKLRNGHNAGGSSVSHLSKHEVNMKCSLYNF